MCRNRKKRLIYWLLIFFKKNQIYYNFITFAENYCYAFKARIFFVFTYMMIIRLFIYYLFYYYVQKVICWEHCMECIGR